jgi:hypothetical protein
MTAQLDFSMAGCWASLVEVKAEVKAGVGAESKAGVEAE